MLNLFSRSITLSDDEKAALDTALWNLNQTIMFAPEWPREHKQMVKDLLKKVEDVTVVRLYR
jgi:hypothetical protein